MDVPLFAGGYYVSRQREAELQARIAGQALRDEEDKSAGTSGWPG